MNDGDSSATCPNVLRSFKEKVFPRIIFTNIQKKLQLCHEYEQIINF